MRSPAVYESDPIDAADLFGVLAGSDERAVIDVLWTSETIRATQLKYLRGLASYRSSNAASIPAEYRDFDAYWTGMAARLRVLAVDTARVAEADVPASVADLVEPAWTGRFGMPGLDNWMSAFHLAALYSDRGDEPADDLLRRMRQNGLELLPDDVAVSTALRDGDIDVALTSSDAVAIAVDAGQPITVIAPDVDGVGVPVLPGAVAMTAWAAHPRPARALIDYLISDEVERMLTQSRARLVPLRPELPVPIGMPPVAGVRTMPFHYARTAAGLERAPARAATILDAPR